MYYSACGGDTRGPGDGSRQLSLARGRFQLWPTASLWAYIESQYTSTALAFTACTAGHVYTNRILYFEYRLTDSVPAARARVTARSQRPARLRAPRAASAVAAVHGARVVVRDESRTARRPGEAAGLCRVWARLPVPRRPAVVGDRGGRLETGRPGVKAEQLRRPGTVRVPPERGEQAIRRFRIRPAYAIWSPHRPATVSLNRRPAVSGPGQSPHRVCIRLCAGRPECFIRLT